MVSYVLDHPSSGMVSPEQAQRWRLFPHGLQCHNTIPNAQGKSCQNKNTLVIVKETKAKNIQCNKTISPNKIRKVALCYHVFFFSSLYQPYQGQ